MHQITIGDCVQWSKEYKGELFHALLCDPPYELGFMGKDWDKSGVAFSIDTWLAFKSVMYPGAFGMAFASSRGWHRLAVAIEDAGFVMHPSIFGWAFGSGFPKATRIDTQIQPKGEQVVTVRDDFYKKSNKKPQRGSQCISGVKGAYHRPTDPTAQQWHGHRYGRQALKPAIEPIIVFQKPYEGRAVDNIVDTGAGAIWIDGGRIGTSDDRTRLNGTHFSAGEKGLERGGTSESNPLGRWPSNLILNHHPSCNGVCVDGCAVRAIGEQSGETGNGYRINNSTNKTTWFGDKTGGHTCGERGHNDTGTAARFFFQVEQQLNNADPIFYCAKASRSERDGGLGETWFVVDGNRLGGEPEDAVLKAGQVHKINLTNTHPTVKPLKLTKYLATLLLPPDTYNRRLFIPFSGVASEMIGALQAGWDFVQGVELNDDYADIAERRIKYYTFSKTDEPATRKDKPEIKTIKQLRLI